MPRSIFRVRGVPINTVKKLLVDAGTVAATRAGGPQVKARPMRRDLVILLRQEGQCRESQGRSDARDLRRAKSRKARQKFSFSK